MRRLVLVLTFLAIAPALAHADCDAAKTQADLNKCYGDAYRKSDAELNKLYKQLQGRLKDGPGDSKQLVAAQRAWVGFRDAECGFASGGGGSVGPMLDAICLDRLTMQRIKDLKTSLQCEEGDVGCVVPPE